MKIINGTVLMGLLLLASQSRAQFELLDTFGAQINSPLMEIQCSDGDCFLISLHEIARTDDMGESYNYLSSPRANIEYQHHNFQSIDSQTLFLSVKVTSPGFDYGLFLSYDGGNNWIEVFSNGNFISDTLKAVNFTMFSDKIGFVSFNYGKIVKTETQFVLKDTVSAIESNSSFFDCLYIDESKIVCGPHKIYGSNNSGDTWFVIDENNISALTRYDSSTFYGVSSGSPSYLMASHDTCNSWSASEIITDVQSIGDRGIHFVNDSTAFTLAAKNDDDPFLLATYDYGETWHSFKIPFGRYLWTMDFVNDSIALIGGHEGVVVRLNINQLSKIDTSDSTNAISKLQQNESVRIFPNPSTNEVNIHSTTSMVQVELLDATGILIKQVVNPPSPKTVQINLKSLPKGIYFLRIETGNETITKKIIKTAY